MSTSKRIIHTAFYTSLKYHAMIYWYESVSVDITSEMVGADQLKRLQETKVTQNYIWFKYRAGMITASRMKMYAIQILPNHLITS